MRVAQRKRNSISCFLKNMTWGKGWKNCLNCSSKFPMRMQDEPKPLLCKFAGRRKGMFFHFALFQRFYMYQIHIKYFTLDLANASLLKTTWSLCRWVHKHVSLPQPSSPWKLTNMWWGHISFLIWCRAFLHMFFPASSLLTQLQQQLLCRYLPLLQFEAMQGKQCSNWVHLRKCHSWCPKCLTIFSLSFFSSSMWASRHSRMCWDLSSSSSRYRAATEPTEDVGRGHWSEKGTAGILLFQLPIRNTADQQVT